MRPKIQTADGPRIVPEWANCYCVSRHTPAYIHPYPFVLPEGEELWLCPNTHHQANTLLGLYRKFNGPPSGYYSSQFTFFVNQLIKLYWQQLMQKELKDSEYQSWKIAQEVGNMSPENYPYFFEGIKRIEF